MSNHVNKSHPLIGWETAFITDKNGSATCQTFHTFYWRGIKEQIRCSTKKNTIRNEEKAVRAFKAYLSEISSKSDNFFTFTESELDQHLAKFWFSLQKQKKDTDSDEETFYRVSSMYTMWHSLNRALKRYGHNFDITRKECISFTKSIKAFKDVIAELKKNTQAGNFITT